MESSKKPKCDHDYDHDSKVISVEPIHPYNLSDMISSTPRDKLFSREWYQVVYECSKCNEMKFMELSEAEAAEEEKSLIN